MLSNGLIALSGSVMAQFQGFADASMGIGTLVLGIASIIIGQTLLRKVRFLKETSMILIGTIIYQFTIYLVMNLGMAASDMKLLTSVVIIIFLGAGRLKFRSNAHTFRKGRLSDVKYKQPVKELY
jgi:putative ABC transport system permease protein